MNNHHHKGALVRAFGKATLLFAFATFALEACQPPSSRQKAATEQATARKAGWEKKPFDLALFKSEAEKERNIFIAPTRQAVIEYRALMGQDPVDAPLTREEKSAVKSIMSRAQKMKAPNPALLFAAERAGVPQDRTQEFMSSPAPDFSVAEWLYMIKTAGGKYGLGFFAEHITSDGKGTVEVDNPTVLRPILALRDNPRILALMSAEYFVNGKNYPAAVAYQGMTETAGIDSAVYRQQECLIKIGFDIGQKEPNGVMDPVTYCALKEFALMTGHTYAADTALSRLLAEATSQAETESRKFSNEWVNLSVDNAFSIRQASKTTRADFGYMMLLANAESGFDNGNTASTSTATGLYQFIENTWLISLYAHGRQYGLGDIVDHIDVTKNGDGVVVNADIRDPFLRQYALSLRNNPSISSLMGAETLKENLSNLQAAFPKRTISRADQYLGHFLGTGSAVSFIRQLEQNPDAPANAVFPAAARSNEAIFYKADKTPRSFEEVYTIFEHKFAATAYDDKKPKPAKAKKTVVADRRLKP